MVRITAFFLWVLLACGLAAPSLAGPIADSNAALQALNHNDLQKAISLANAALKTGALQSYLHSNTLITRGVAYFRTGRSDLAIADYTEAIALVPSAFIAFYDRGLAFSVNENTPRGLADYNTAIRLNPRFAGAYDARSRYFIIDGDYRSALRDANRAIALDPRDAAHFIRRADVYSAQNNLEKALADNTHAIQLDPNNARAFVQRGDIEYGQGGYEAALADYSHALRLPRVLSNAYFRRAITYLRLNDLSAAANDYRLAQREPHSAANAALSLARLQVLTRDDAGASASFAQALRLNQTPADRTRIVIWEFIAALRDGAKPGEAIPHAADTANLTHDVWPWAAAAMFLGRIDADHMLVAAKSPNLVTQRNQLCEAHYFAAEFALANAQTDRGLEQLRIATGSCPSDAFEFAAAGVRLTELTAQSPEPAPSPSAPS